MAILEDGYSAEREMTEEKLAPMKRVFIHMSEEIYNGIGIVLTQELEDAGTSRTTCIFRSAETR